MDTCRRIRNIILQLGEKLGWGRIPAIIQADLNNASELIAIGDESVTMSFVNYLHSMWMASKENINVSNRSSRQHAIVVSGKTSMRNSIQENSQNGGELNAHHIPSLASPKRSNHEPEISRSRGPPKPVSMDKPSTRHHAHFSGSPVTDSTADSRMRPSSTQHKNAITPQLIDARYQQISKTSLTSDSAPDDEVPTLQENDNVASFEKDDQPRASIFMATDTRSDQTHAPQISRTATQLALESVQSRHRRHLSDNSDSDGGLSQGNKRVPALQQRRSDSSKRVQALEKNVQQRIERKSAEALIEQHRDRTKAVTGVSNTAVKPLHQHGRTGTGAVRHALASSVSSSTSFLRHSSCSLQSLYDSYDSDEVTLATSQDRKAVVSHNSHRRSHSAPPSLRTLSLHEQMVRQRMVESTSGATQFIDVSQSLKEIVLAWLDRLGVQAAGRVGLIQQHEADRSVRDLKTDEWFNGVLLSEVLAALLRQDKNLVKQVRQYPGNRAYTVSYSQL